MLLAATLLGFRSVVAAVAVCQMAVGDGVADIVGRRYAPPPLPLTAAAHTPISALRALTTHCLLYTSPSPRD